MQAGKQRPSTAAAPIHEDPILGGIGPVGESRPPWTLAPILTPALAGGSPDSFNAADSRYRGFQGREFPLRRIGRRNANKPVAGPSFLGLFYGGFKLGRLTNNNRRAALQ